MLKLISSTSHQVRATPASWHILLKMPPSTFNKFLKKKTNEEQLINVDEPWCVQFSNGSLFQDQDPVIVQHRVQPMGDRDDCAGGDGDE